MEKSEISNQVSDTSTVPTATRKQQPKSPTSQGELESLSWLASLSGALKTCCLVGIPVLVRFSEKTNQGLPSCGGQVGAWSDFGQSEAFQGSGWDSGLALGLRTQCRKRVEWTRPQAHICHYIGGITCSIQKDTGRTQRQGPNK